jgi:hypothetical protein
MLRRIIIFVFLVMITTLLHGQYRYHHPDIFIYPSVNHSAAPNDAEQRSDPFPSPWLRYSVDAGSWFRSMNGYNSFGTYLSPRMFIPAGSRMMIETGLTFVSAWMPAEGEGGTSRYSGLIGYARGIFAAGDKTTIYGEVAGSLTGIDPLSGTGESQPLLPGGNFRSYTIGVEHFITPNLRVGASVTSTQGYDPRYPFSPYSRYRSDYMNPWYY